LSFLSAQSRAALNDLGNIVDEKMSRFKQSGKAETTRFRQAVYIAWTARMFMADPCGPEIGYQRIVCCFLEQLTRDNNARSATVRGYMESINILFERRNLPIPSDFRDVDNMNVKLFAALEKEENVAKQRSPLTKEMFARMVLIGKTSPINSAKAVLYDWFCVIRIAGFRCAEYAQTKQTSVDIHEYPSGRKVVKAFTAPDWTFYAKDGSIINSDNWQANSVVPHKVKLLFRIQKNRQNGQTLTIVADDNHVDICPVRAAYRIVIRAKALGQLENEPSGVFINHQGVKRYLTGSKIADLLRALAKEVHPGMTTDDLSKMSSHSGRVWALVLLDEAGMSPSFIKARLRWLGDSYRLYLRDTSVIQQNHIKALNPASDEIINIVECANLPTIVPIDDGMGNYDADPLTD